MSKLSEKKIYVRKKVVSLKNIKTLSPTTRIIASIEYALINSDGYQRKIQEVDRKKQRARKELEDELVKIITSFCYEPLYKNKEPYVELFIDSKYEDVLVKITNKEWEYETEIVPFKANIKQCFVNVPFLIIVRKAVQLSE